MRISEILKEEDDWNPSGPDPMCDNCAGDGTIEIGKKTYNCPECNSGAGKEELEEIKVTKTVAGKRAAPSQTLAGKLKKKKPNQGKPAVEIHKHKDCKELANNLLKGQYKS